MPEPEGPRWLCGDTKRRVRSLQFASEAATVCLDPIDVLFVTVVIAVLKQSGSTVRVKAARIDLGSMFSWFSTWPPFAL